LRRRLFGLDLSDETVAFGLAANSVGLGLFNRRGMTLHADAKLDTEIEGLFVREA
jgi:hypothetical protein